MLLDKGLGLGETGDLLELSAPYIDYIKFTFGTAALYPADLLRAKIALIKSYGVAVYPGGTFLEIALSQNVLEPYLDRCKQFGFTHIEVSDGTIDLSREHREQAIALARQYGFPVITEVGKKDDTVELDPADALAQIQADLDAGAAKVIVEGRESGTGVGIYDADGRPRQGALEELASGLDDPSVLMWEAPLKSQQAALIARFGPNVNLGNIVPADALALEGLRRGLRGDTFSLVSPSVR
jgi:phosphosulfolactate synthase